jgi:hypothetical protein
MKKELTHSLYAGPSAPMSLQSYTGYAEHDKNSKYPFQASQGFKPVFKVVLNSNSAVLANNVYTFNGVNMTDIKGKVLRCGVASVISNGNITLTAVYNLHLNPLIQMRGYDSRTKGIGDMIFNGRSGVDYVMPVSEIDCNVEIDADAVRRTNTLQVYFTDLNGTRIQATNIWQIVLWFYAEA